MKPIPNVSTAYRLLHDGTIALAKIERNGMRIDLELCAEHEKTLTKKINELELKIKGSSFYKNWTRATKGIPNLYSNQQLGYFLYDVLKIKPVKTTTSGKGSTDEEALSKLNVKELNDLLQIRKLLKIRDTYLKSFVREQINGWIHPSFNLHTVRTYRSSSNNPNFQNVPKRDKEAMYICRSVIFPRKGHQLMELDYGSLEVRIAACYHQDPEMIRYLKDDSSDMHGDMTKEIFLLDTFDKSIPGHSHLRAATKNGFVFPQFYGDYYKNNAYSLAVDWCGMNDKRWSAKSGTVIGDTIIGKHLISKGITSMNKFIDHIKKIENHFWNDRFPVYKKWKEDTWNMYLRTGQIPMFTGFVCTDEMRKNEAINRAIQGSAFHCLLWSLIQVDKFFTKNNYKSRFIGQIHDALVVDVYPPELMKVAKIVKKIATEELPKNWKWINVPLKIEADLGGVDESWHLLKPYDLNTFKII